MERWQRVMVAALAGVIVALGAFSAGVLIAERRNRVIEIRGNSHGLSLIRGAFDRIRSSAIDPPSAAKLARGAIKGMVGTLKHKDDPYALFYSPKGYRSFQELTTGRFSGIGVLLRQPRRGVLQIAKVLPGSPALDAGLQRGDVITSIDGDSVTKMSSDEAVGRIKGRAGTKVALGIRRAGGDLTLEVERARIDFPNVSAHMIRGDLGYARLFGFANGAGAQLRDQIERLTSQGAKGLILDLRDNGGGLFTEGINVASLFIEDGTIVTYESRSQPDKVYKARGNAFENLPLVVLVNGGTASASEIVTGALQDTGRDVVVGTKTYGKGSVQEVVPLPDSSALKLTIAAYLTPDGRNLSGDGIDPDVEVNASPDVQKRRAQQILRGIAISSANSQG